MKYPSIISVVGIILIVVFVGVMTVKADSEPVPSEDNMSIQIEQLDWLVGHWEGEGFGGVCEEVWSPASAGTMVGTFKLSIEGSVKFYELMTIAPDSAGLLLRVKHFNPELVGWEEKDKSAEFRFTDASDNSVQFDGLKYTLIEPDKLTIAVTISHKDGSTSEELIRCTRQPR